MTVTSVSLRPRAPQASRGLGRTQRGGVTSRGLPAKALRRPLSGLGREGSFLGSETVFQPALTVFAVPYFHDY